jgi:hypothetical protein
LSLFLTLLKSRRTVPLTHLVAADAGAVIGILLQAGVLQHAPQQLYKLENKPANQIKEPLNQQPIRKNEINSQSDQ